MMLWYWSRIVFPSLVPVSVVVYRKQQHLLVQSQCLYDFLVCVKGWGSG